MSRPVLLDLFCGAGGTSQGYFQVGFDVVGVDSKPQPRYPFRFALADAFEYVREHGLAGVSAIHASPPCQAYSVLTRMQYQDNHPRLIGRCRDLLLKSGLPYVIENVQGAPLWNPLLLCGSMFELSIERGDLQRHRLFETNFFVEQPLCRHSERPIVGVYGHSRHRNKPHMLSEAEASRIMEIDWMTARELSQAIPPVYTKYIGWHLMKHLKKNPLKLNHTPRRRTIIAKKLFEQIKIIPGEHWLWTGNYRVPAHTVAYELFVGPIPKGWNVHRVCEQETCFNPRHLRAWDHTEHMRYHIDIRTRDERGQLTT